MHCCLAAFYIDDFSYQENILPRIHRELGHDVEILASTETYLDRIRLAYTNSSMYRSRDGIRVTRLPYVRWIPAKLVRKLRIYNGLAKELERFSPNVVFLHDCQFLSVIEVEAYARKTGAIVYVDSHTDHVNSGRSFLSRYVLHGMIYRWCARRIDRVTRWFYATLPVRADFLCEVYGLPASKIRLLPFGADDSRIRDENRADVRACIRAQLSIGADELVFVTGGKIDSRKAIHVLADGFMRLSDEGKLPNTKLVIFGKPEPGLMPILKAAMQHPAVRWVDWVDAKDIFRYFWAGDIAFFPGTHSVLWEEAIGLGVGCVFKRWPGMEHLDIGGNCLFIDETTVGSVQAVMLELHQDGTMRNILQRAALNCGPRVFSYSRIARYAIELEEDSPTQVVAH
jgi:hypothetical protein